QSFRGKKNRRLQLHGPLIGRINDREKQNARSPKRDTPLVLQQSTMVSENIGCNYGGVTDQRRQITKQSDSSKNQEKEQSLLPTAEIQRQRRDGEDARQFNPEPGPEGARARGDLLFRQEPNRKQKEERNRRIGVAVICGQQNRERIDPVGGG